MRYGEKRIVRGELSEKLKEIPLAVLERETGLSRHTIVRGREGKGVQARSLQLLRIAVRTIQVGNAELSLDRLHSYAPHTGNRLLRLVCFLLPVGGPTRNLSGCACR